MKKILHLVALNTFCLSLLGCQILNPPDNHHAICKEMRSRMVFNGQDASPSVAFRERAERAKLAQSYRDERCF